MYSAIKSGDLKYCKQLIAEGADIEQRTTSGEPILCLAIELGYKQIVEQLLLAGANPDQCGWASPLELAARQQDLEIVEMLIDAGADVNLTLDGSTPLMAASIRNSLDIVQLLIQAGAEPDFRRKGGLTALTLSIVQVKREIYNYLSSVTSPEVKLQAIKNALALTSVDDKVDAIELLIQSSINLDMFVLNNYSALMLAAINRNPNSIKVLLEGGANVNLQNQNGQTALMLAVRFRSREESRYMLTRKDNSYIESIRILLNSDIDPNLSDQEGKTALLHAIEFGSLESIPLLIQSGASINSGNNQEESYLIYLRDLQLIDNDRYLKITKALARANLL